MKKKMYLQWWFIFVLIPDSVFSQNFISYTIPYQNQVFVPRLQQIQIGFSELMDTLSLNNNSIVVYGLLSGKHTGYIVYNTSNNEMTFTSSKSFACGERVFVTLTSEIKNVSGNPQYPPYGFCFHTQSDSGHSVMYNTKVQGVSELYSIGDVKTADMDGDNDYDLVFSSHYSFQSGRKIIIYKNDGQANFISSFYYWLPDVPGKLSLGDFNNDTYIDVAVITPYNIVILKNNGTGYLNFYANIELYLSGIINSGDFNNDGKMDLLCLEFDDSAYPQKRKVCFIKNMGDGNFEKVYSYQFPSSYQETFFYDEIADLNNDGFIDLILSRIFSQKVLLLVNNGDGIFSEVANETIEGTPYSIAAGDFDTDSDIDLAIATVAPISWEGLKIYQNLGSLNFYYAHSFYLHSFPVKTVSTDFNNDGNLDVASVFGYGLRIGIYFGTNSLLFSSPYNVNLDRNAVFMEYADFDSDGDVDLITLNEYYADRKIYFLENGVAPPPPPPIPVELSIFNYIKVSTGILLNWVTVSEINNFGFELYRDSSMIAFIEGNGTSLNMHHYNYLDTLFIKSKHSYRLIQVDYNGNKKLLGKIIIDFDPHIKKFDLYQCYPNPFNPTTKIKYQIPSSPLLIKGESEAMDFVTLKVYDVLGNEVATLVNEQKSSGTYEVEFDGSELPSGIYFYQLNAGSFTGTKKMVLLR